MMSINLVLHKNESYIYASSNVDSCVSNQKSLVLICSILYVPTLFSKHLDICTKCPLTFLTYTA